MKKIGMLNLAGQHDLIKSDLIAAFEKVLIDSDYIGGESVRTFEKELAQFLGIKHVISCGNGTDAIQIALMSLDLKSGDEILVPSFTYVASAEAIALLGLSPVFVEVNIDTFNIDIADIKKKLTSKTKAILAVNLYGQPCDLLELRTLCDEFNLFLIEDNAQSLGSYIVNNGKKIMAGTVGDISTTSFFPSKNLGCLGDGGAIMTDDDNLAQKLRQIANHGQKEKYVHDMIGVNSRLDTIQAAILSIKLVYLNEYSLQRRKVAHFYNEELRELNVTTPHCAENCYHVYHQYTLLLENEVERNELQEFLKERNVQTMIYYPLPIHKQKAYKVLNVNLSTSEDLAKRVLSLPIHPVMEKKEMKFIIDQIKLFYER